MPRASKNNRRKGPKVTRRVNTHRMKRIFGDDSVRQQWDVTKTPSMNYAAMALTKNANTTELLEEAFKSVKGGPATFVDVDEIRSLSAATVPKEIRRPPHWMSDEECFYLTRCSQLHGDNYRKMARDLKTNYMQHSAEHLETRMARLLLFKSTSAAVN